MEQSAVKDDGQMWAEMGRGVFVNAMVWLLCATLNWIGENLIYYYSLPLGMVLFTVYEISFLTFAVVELLNTKGKDWFHWVVLLSKFLPLIGMVMIIAMYAQANEGDDGDGEGADSYIRKIATLSWNQWLGAVMAIQTLQRVLITICTPRISMASKLD